MISTQRPFAAPIIACVAAGLALLAAASPAAATSRHHHPATEPAAATDPAIGAHPALWKVTQGKATIYLFGTVHALPKGVAWFAGPVADAFGGSDELVTEIIEKSPEDMRAIVTATATLPEGQSLRALMPPRDRAAFEKLMKTDVLPVAAFDRFRPWYAAVALSTLPLLHSGYDPANGVDSQLTDKAKAAGLDHEALETPEFQLGLFGSLPLRLQERYLRDVINSAPKIPAELASMIRAWKAGDAKKLAQVINADEDDPLLRKKLLIDRNIAWAKWIKTRLATPGTVFIAVGAGHLAGPGSVLDQLKALGIATSRLQ